MKIKYLLLFIVLFPIHVLSQNIIEAIGFPDAKKTKIHFIQRFINSKVGNEFSYKVLDEDIQALENLGLFYYIRYELIESFQKTTILFRFKERLVRLPFLNFGIIEDQIFFQLGFQDLNFKGSAQQIGAFYTRYDRNSYDFYYKSPYLMNSNWGISTFLSKQARTEPFSFNNITGDYNYDSYSIEILGRYNFRWSEYLLFGGSYLLEKYDRLKISQKNENLPAYLETNKYIIKSKLALGITNYKQTLESGISHELLAEGVFSNFNDFFYKFIYQIKIKKIFAKKYNFSNRIKMGISQNVQSPFVPFVVDSYINFRGSGNRVFRGTAEMLVNSELRYQVKHFEKISFQIVGFFDQGFIRASGRNLRTTLNVDNYILYGGIGGRIYLNKFYGLILRADYG